MPFLGCSMQVAGPNGSWWNIWNFGNPPILPLPPGYLYQERSPPKKFTAPEWQDVGDFFLDSAGSQTLDFFPSSKKMEGIYHENRKNGSPFIFCWDWDLIRSVFFSELAPRFVDLVFYGRCWWGWLVLVPGGCGYTEFKCFRRPVFFVPLGRRSWGKGNKKA